MAEARSIASSDGVSAESEVQAEKRHKPGLDKDRLLPFLL